MVWLDVVPVLAVALLMVALLALIRGVTEGGPAIVWLFALVFLLTWALGVWIPPLGPPIWGIFWLRFLIAGVLAALLLAVLAAPSRGWGPAGWGASVPASVRETRMIGESAENDIAEAAGCGLAFWIVVFVAVFAIAARYVWW